MPNKTQAQPQFGIWVEAEGPDSHRPFNNREEFNKLISFTGKYPFTDLYCQIFRRGLSWFPSVLADDTPFRTAKQSGVDPLRELILISHARGQKVHAWLNVLRVNDNPDAPIFKAAGEKVALSDNYGNSLLTYSPDGIPPHPAGKYFSLETPGVWLDPSSIALREYMKAVVREVLTQYPDIDGIHLDMIRFPFAMKIASGAPRLLEFGFGDETLLRFKDAMQNEPTFFHAFSSKNHSPAGKEWVKWRKDQVTEIVEVLRKEVEKIDKSKEFSAAVIASHSRAHDHAFQDWSRWMKEGLIDSTLLMNYTTKNDTFTERTNKALEVKKSTKLQAGIGAWMMLDNPEQAVAQANIAMEKGADGVVLFSYANLQNKRGSDLVQKLASDFFIRFKQEPKN